MTGTTWAQRAWVLVMLTIIFTIIVTNCIALGMHP